MPRIPWRVAKVTLLDGYKLEVHFRDGTCGVVKFLLSHFNGVFIPLKNPDFFKKVFIADGVVTWPGQIDLAPDAMYDEIKKHGEWILS